MAMAGLPHPSTLQSPDDLDDRRNVNGSDMVIGRLASLKEQPQYTKSTGRRQVGPSGPIDREAWQSAWFRISESPEEIKAQLEGLRDGNFAVRRDLLNASDIALFYVYGGEVCSEQLLALSSGGVRLEHGSLVFRNVSHLVAHHTEQRGELPVQLTVKAAPFIPEEGYAEEGDPYRVNDVCKWLQDIGLGQYKEEFRRLGVDGAGLANMTEEQLRLRFGMSPQHQAVFFQEREKLDKVRIQLSARHTEARTTSYIVKDIDGRMRAFDADTGEEITEPTPEFMNYVQDLDPQVAAQLEQDFQQRSQPAQPPAGARSARSAQITPATEVTVPLPVAKGDFEWLGPAHGWVRHAQSRRVTQDEFSVRDVQAWLETYDHQGVQEGFRAQQVDGPTFASLTDGDLRRIGQLYQVPEEFVKAGREFRQNSTNVHPPSIDAFIDSFAETAPWYKVDLPYVEALSDLDDKTAPPNAFVVCQDPDRTGHLRIELLTDPVRGDIRAFPIEVVSDAGIRLQGREFVAGSLSELVQYYGAYNEEPGGKWLLNTEASEDLLKEMPWYSAGTPTTQELNNLRSQPEGTFILHPVSDGTGDSALRIVHQGNITTLRLLESEEGVHVDTRPEYLFYNCQHLVDYYSFVRHNHLGFTLFRDADEEEKIAQGHSSDSQPRPKWFMPNVDRGTAETVLGNAPNGTFLVRDSTSPDARYCLSYVYNGEVYHMLIDEDRQGASFREAPEAFNTVDDLIDYHQRPEQTALFCPLAGVASVPGSTRDLQSLARNERSVPPATTEPIVVPVQSRNAPQQAGYGVLGDGSDYWLMLDPITKAEALASLQGRPEGSFVIRSSERFMECTVLSYVHGNQILHELVGVDVNEADEPIGIHLVKEGNVIFPDFRALVDYHKMNQTVLQTLLVEPDNAAMRAPIMPSTSARSLNVATTTYLRETAPWLVTGMDEKDALSLLKGKPDGAFIIRQSPESADALILSYVAEGFIHQNYVEMDEEGVHLQSNPNARFLTLHELVAHYSTKRDELKTALRVHDGRMALSHSNSREMVQSRSAITQGQSVREDHLTLASQHERSRQILRNRDTLDYNNKMFFVGQSDGQREALEAVHSSRTLLPPKRKSRAITSGSQQRSSHHEGHQRHHHQRHHHHEEHHGHRTERASRSATRGQRSSSDTTLRRRPTAVLTLPFQRGQTVKRQDEPSRRRSSHPTERRSSSRQVVRERQQPRHAVLTVPFGQGSRMDTTLRRRREKQPKQQKTVTTEVEESEDGKTRTVTTTTVIEPKPEKTKAPPKDKQVKPEKAKKEKKPQKEKTAKPKKNKKQASKDNVKPAAEQADNTVPTEPTPLEDSTDVPVRRGSRPLPVIPTDDTVPVGVQEGNVDEAAVIDQAVDVVTKRNSWKKTGYSKEEVVGRIGQEDGAFIVHSPAEGAGERVLAALTFRSRGNLVTRDILSDDQEIFLQGSAERFTNLDNLVVHYLTEPQTDINVQNLRLPTEQ
eukprot:m.184197 g.184197  ORF g.184197 m.184197 type:complete len:1484 (-) comp16903_c0_seq1:255-4706(-)